MTVFLFIFGGLDTAAKRGDAGADPERFGWGTVCIIVRRRRTMRLEKTSLEDLCKDRFSEYRRFCSAVFYTDLWRFCSADTRM